MWTTGWIELLARICRPGLAPDAFIGGLLHHLGTAVQVQLDLPGIRAMIERRGAHDTRDIRLLEAELAAMGFGRKAIVSICADGGLGTVALLQSV